MSKVKKPKIPPLLRFVRWVFPRLEKVSPALAKRLFITLFFTPLRYRVPEKEKAVERQASMFSLQAAGKRIQCYEWGEGPVVVLVHGWAGRATQFRGIIPALVRAGFRVVGFDGPAHGRSGGRRTTIVEFEETLRNLYEKTGVPQGVVAHSFGGPAVLYAAMNGLRVNKLVNIASPTVGDDIIDTYLRNVHGSPAMGDQFRAYIHDKFGVPFDEYSALHIVQKLPEPVDLLLVHDRDDMEVSIENAIRLQKSYPSARLFETTGLGHTRILRDENVIEACIAFLRG